MRRNVRARTCTHASKMNQHVLFEPIKFRPGVQGTGGPLRDGEERRGRGGEREGRGRGTVEVGAEEKVLCEKGSGWEKRRGMGGGEKGRVGRDAQRTKGSGRPRRAAPLDFEGGGEKHRGLLDGPDGSRGDSRVHRRSRSRFGEKEKKPLGVQMGTGRNRERIWTVDGSKRELFGSSDGRFGSSGWDVGHEMAWQDAGWKQRTGSPILHSTCRLRLRSFPDRPPPSWMFSTVASGGFRETCTCTAEDQHRCWEWTVETESITAPVAGSDVQHSKDLERPSVRVRHVRDGRIGVHT